MIRFSPMWLRPTVSPKSSAVRYTVDRSFDLLYVWRYNRSEPTLTSARPPTRVREAVRTVAAPPLIVVKCGRVVLHVVVCRLVLVVSCVVSVLLCVCVCDLLLFYLCMVYTNVYTDILTDVVEFNRFLETVRSAEYSATTSGPTVRLKR